MNSDYVERLKSNMACARVNDATSFRVLRYMKDGGYVSPDTGKLTTTLRESDTASQTLPHNWEFTKDSLFVTRRRNTTTIPSTRRGRWRVQTRTDRGTCF